MTRPESIVAVFIFAAILSGCGGGGKGEPGPTGVTPPEQEITAYAADTLVVRMILDLNGDSSVPVDSVADSSNGRVVRLAFPGTVGFNALPDTFRALTGLKRMDILNQVLPDGLPGPLFTSTSLETLVVNDTRLDTLPEAIKRLVNLKALTVVHCDMRVIDTIRTGELSSLKTLDIRSNGMYQLPETIICLPVDVLINVQWNHLCYLSSDLIAWLNQHAVTGPSWASGQICWDPYPTLPAFP